MPVLRLFKDASVELNPAQFAIYIKIWPLDLLGSGGCQFLVHNKLSPAPLDGVVIALYHPPRISANQLSGIEDSIEQKRESRFMRSDPLFPCKESGRAYSFCAGQGL